MKVKVRDVHPNPYRNIEHYPLNKEKIMALTKSIEKTGFWDNLVGRKEDGKIQIAYGHHRIEALRLAEGYGYDYEFDLPVRDIDNGTMIKIMANENMQEWTHSIGVYDETVKTTKKFLENNDAFIAAKDAYHKKTNDRYKGVASGKDISDFLGWNSDKVNTSLRRIEAIESGKVSKVALQTFQPEKSKHFLSSIEKYDFTPQEQESIAEELIEDDVSRHHFKTVVERFDDEKKNGKDFGKKKKEENKEAKKLKEFDSQLAFISYDTSSLASKYKELTSLKDELHSVTSKNGLFHLKTIFMSFAKLENEMARFKKAMTENTEDITDQVIEEIKQLKE